ncbi:MAG: UDP-2,3-diacylglucosamine diphosphatase [Bacteroidia bacterium]|nr:UDP-2,3-diacylglucosamine diphosphatase [Bacteroidia bacterium]NNJ55716.1 UDP-2,3-diacylglucosamine diphosphatase [Bacteroidia bacterium]
MGKSYFASDFHLGVPNYEESLIREKKIVQWLDSIKGDCSTLFLLGDVFDFWYEYDSVIPRYFTRLLGKLAELSDSGIHIFFFKGNHDMWTFDYLEKEIGVNVIDEEWIGEIDGKKFFIHHGDALWKGETMYKLIRKVFRSKIGIWLFHRLHPNFGVGLANFLSRKSRRKNSVIDQIEIPLDKEYQFQFAKNYLKENNIDYFVFGHRHNPMDIPLQDNSRLINLGDWVSQFTYAVFDGNEMELKTYHT